MQPGRQAGKMEAPAGPRCRSPQWLGLAEGRGRGSPNPQSLPWFSPPQAFTR